MCHFQIRLTCLTLSLDFEEEAHVFRIWSSGHEILQIKMPTIVQKR